MKYSNIISDFIWSYSRVQSFFSCRYQFFLKYIKGLRERPMFFSDYGGFVHQIMEQYLQGELDEQDLSLYYLTHFREAVGDRLPIRTFSRSILKMACATCPTRSFPTPLLLRQSPDFPFR